MKKVSILIPAFNEELVIDALYERLVALARAHPKYRFEFLFVNDGSTDNTLERIKKYTKQDDKVSYINLSRNFGKEVAMAAGLDHARGDAAVIIDADLQDPPELISEMLEYWEQGYDDIYARRRTRNGETWLKKHTSAWYYRLLQSSTAIPIQIDSGDFRLLDRKCIDALRSFKESQRNTKGLFSWIGYRKKEVYFDRDPRIAGETKWNYTKLFNLAIDGLTSFTTSPLRISSILGFIVSIVTFLYIIYLLVRPVFGVSTGDGYSSLMAVILFLGGVQLLSIGIIGEYIARIFLEAKARPLYLVEEYHEAKSAKK